MEPIHSISLDKLRSFHGPTDHKPSRGSRLLAGRVGSSRRWRVNQDSHLQPTCLADDVRAKRLKENLTAKEFAKQLGLRHISLKHYELHLAESAEKSHPILLEYLGFDLACDKLLVFEDSVGFLPMAR